MTGPPRPKPPSAPTHQNATPTKPWPVWLVVLVVAIPAILLVALETKGFKNYGPVLFIVVPLCTGIISSWLYNRNRDWNLLKTFWVVLLTLMVVGWGMVGFKIEGIYCVAMAAWLGGFVSLIGMGIAWLIRKLGKQQKTTLLIICGLIPFTMGLEREFKPKPPLLQQTTVIEINAPPEIVWKFIPSFPKIEAPLVGLLRFGLAFPIKAELDSEGVGASRRCVLSTGSMPEIITAWEPGKRLEFDILATPPAMEETNPFGQTDAAHTTGYFIVKHGRFILTALPNGRTQVEGTSWFYHDLWPQAYWAPITKQVVKEIHQRVLLQVKTLSENMAMQHEL